MKKPTPRQVRRYVKEDPNCCPLCGDAGIEGDSVDIEGRYAYQNVWCGACDFEWTNVYELVAMSEGDRSGEYPMEDECQAENS